MQSQKNSQTSKNTCFVAFLAIFLAINVANSFTVGTSIPAGLGLPPVSSSVSIEPEGVFIQTAAGDVIPVGSVVNVPAIVPIPVPF